MKKIPTIFERDWEGDRSRVVNTPNPECGWVFSGEGVATQKVDGTCCMIEGGRLWKRRELKKGAAEPEGFKLEDVDEKTGKRVGWVTVADSPEDKYHQEALDGLADIRDGTYELVGPKIQGNPEHFGFHVLLPHDSLTVYQNPPRDFDGLRSWLSGRDIEGLVFHHPDGRMAKIKLRDFGLKRPA